MRLRPQILRLLFLCVFTPAATAAQAQAPGPDLDSQARAALRDAAASQSLEPWQRGFMLRLAGGPRSFAGDSVRNDAMPDSVRSDQMPEVSELAEGSWSIVPPAPPFTVPPDPRVTTTGTYDPVRRRMIVFGGGGAGLMNDAWALKLDHPFDWTLLSPTGTPPPPRRLHGAVFDPARDRMMVFGGSGNVLLNDTWALQFAGATGASWVPIASLGTPPAPRADFAMICDPVGDRILVFGGFDGVSPPSGRLADLWQLALAGTPQWTQLAPGAGPSARSGHRAAYDPVRAKMIVFAGYDTGFLSDTWALSLSGPLAWTQVLPPGSPPGPRVEHSVLYDPVGDRLLIHGGYDDPNNQSILGDTWALPLGSPGPWQPIISGVPLWGFAAILDPVRREMIVFGGLDYDGLFPYTVALDLFGTPSWSLYPPPGGPSVVTPSAVYDPARRRMVVFGGGRSEYSDNVHILNLGTSPSWMPLFPTGALPAPRRLHGAVFDPVGDRMIVFGGFDGSNRNDTWSLQFSGAMGAAWTQILPAGPLPAGRCDFAMILDAPRNRIVVFGGFDGVSPPTGRRGDLWTLSLGAIPAWTQLAVPGAPTARSGQRAVFDPPRNRMVMFGGYDVAMLNDTWQLTLAGTPAWSPIPAGGPLPGPRADHALVYDSVRQRLVLHAGYDGVVSFGDTWVLPFTGPSVWTDITPIGGPAERWGVAGVYDFWFDRMVVFGGSNYDPLAYALSFGMPTPTALALLSVEARPGLVRLVWHGPDTRGLVATVYRREAGTDWRALGAAGADHQGRIVWEDRGVVAGASYQYRLGVVENGRETFFGATSAIVPAGFELMVRAISPAVAAGRIGLWCAAPAPGPARLEILDLAGRRVAVRDLDWSSAGAMQVEIAPAPPSGLYFARLSQRGHAAHARVSVIH